MATKKRNDGKRKQLTHIKNTSYAPPPYKNLCMGQLIYFAIFFIVPLYVDPITETNHSLDPKLLKNNSVVKFCNLGQSAIK